MHCAVRYATKYLAFLLVFHLTINKQKRTHFSVTVIHRTFYVYFVRKNTFVHRDFWSPHQFTQLNTYAFLFCST